VGFLHDFSSHQTKQSLVYELQEPFRWIADVTVTDAFESGVLDLPVFFPLKWDTVIEQKAAELGCYLVDKSRRLDFSEPSPTLDRMDGRELRERILSLSSSEARRIGKSTLHAQTGWSRGVRLDSRCPRWLSSRTTHCLSPSEKYASKCASSILLHL
jgi:CRISPR-associated protein Cas1